MTARSVPKRFGMNAGRLVVLVGLLLAGCSNAPGASSPVAPSSSTGFASPSPTSAPVSPSSSPATTSASCAVADAGPSTPVVAPDGTTYEMALGRDADGNVQWTLVATNVRGVSGTGWREALDPCWQPQGLIDTEIVIAADSTVYVVLGHRVGAGWDGSSDLERLVTAGPDGVRATLPMRDRHQLFTSPDGTVYIFSLDKSDWTSSLAALGPDGRQRAGWPFTSKQPLSNPAFGADGTVYLAQGTFGSEHKDSEGQIVALGPDGRMQPGWPYVIQGRLVEMTECGEDIFYPPRSPSIAPDGSLYDAFHNGIYMVGPDGQAKPGWPYLLPTGLSVPCEGGSQFAPIRTTDGRIYLPLDDGVSSQRSEITCLLPDGAACPGWPVSLPEGTAVYRFSVNEHGIVHAEPWLADGCGPEGTDSRIDIRPDGSIIE